MRIFKDVKADFPMNEVTILVTDDDQGHASLIIRNIKRAAITNKIIHFEDGQEILDFLLDNKNSEVEEQIAAKSYLLLLDIRMPKVSGIDVLKTIKSTPELKSLPVIMLTTSDNPQEVKLCHELGCSSYITKPIEYEKFVEAIQRLGMFIQITRIPKLNDDGMDPAV